MERRAKVVVGVTAVLVGALLAGALFEPVREWRHVNANERVASELPIFPGAVEASREHHGKHQNEAMWVTDWTTSIAYQLPESTTAHEVLAFFEEHAPAEWQRDRPVGVGSERHLLALCRGGEGPFGDGGDRVMVNADHVATHSTYTLSVD